MPVQGKNDVELTCDIFVLKLNFKLVPCDRFVVYTKKMTDQLSIQTKLATVNSLTLVRKVTNRKYTF